MLVVPLLATQILWINLLTDTAPAASSKVPSSVERARTVAFAVLGLAQLFNCLNSRSERMSAFHGAEPALR